MVRFAMQKKDWFLSGCSGSRGEDRKKRKKKRRETIGLKRSRGWWLFSRCMFAKGVGMHAS